MKTTIESLGAVRERERERELHFSNIIESAVLFNSLAHTLRREKIKTDNKSETGITLIALVITIIILLILAGVSIVMLSGENGIINKAQQAKEETEKAEIKEELSLARVRYEADNENIKLSDFLADEEKSGLKDIYIISEKDEVVVGKYENYLFVIDEKGEVGIGKNLVRNGLGEEKNNNNFSSMTYNEDGYFSITSDTKNKRFVTTDYIEIDPNKKYFQSMDIKSNRNSITYVGFVEYDEDYKSIVSLYHLYIDGTLTYLAKDLNNGDTEVYLNDVSNFKKETQYYQRGFIFWNYKNNSGYQYPELTYSRNVYHKTDDGRGCLWNDANDIDYDNNIIHLNEKWNYGKIEKGTKVSQRNSGANYNYGLLSGKNIPTSWETLTNKITGTNNTGGISMTSFSPATKYIKIYIMFNYNSQNLTTLDIKNVIFTELE